ncbi:hypothetical protein, partial [Proteus mirabilis]|uniref:hypothetical protein n=1 Tax=Proteus mirabilis TaxID=584 RepID=UPI004055A598
EWVHVQLHQQKGMISLSPPTICNSADHIALGYSAKNFYETTNFMGQTVREFGASKITVWWGSIYAKIAYASLAGLIGYGVKVATDD